MAEWILSAAAEADLDQVAFYTTYQFGEQQAQTYTAEIKRGIQVVCDMPFLARSYVTSSGRALQRYNVGQHAIFFQRRESDLFVVRILHGMMDFDRHLDGR